ncbi:MAG: CRISPR-associated endonuclease Cas2 [Bacteroidales bacterium]|nr:CRISPR-associated endonuclease Cas2 [Bacteroidales bacterium]
MTKKKSQPALGFVQRMLKFHRVGIDGAVSPNRKFVNIDEIDSLDKRIEALLGLITTRRKASQMLFFVMYDIENNKVRTQIAKYLLKKGCTRIQRSIFLADLDQPNFEQIKSDLAEVQACYENFDSILVVPISTDYLQAMKVIGQSLQIDIITRSGTTLFF